MKKFKTVIAIILAVVMCFSSAPLTAFANAVNATPIEVGTATAVIENPGDEALFSFTPTEAGKYSLTSYSGRDTRAYLYDSNMDYITEDDDSGDANNFYLSYVLEAGTTYYFGVKFFDTSTNGSIPVELIKSKSIKSIEIVTLPDKTEYVEGHVDGNIDVTGLELKFTWIDDTTDIWQYSNENPYFEGVELQKSYMFDDEISQAMILLFYENVSTSFNITLIDNPVESVEIIDNGFPNLIENTYGEWDFYHNEETNQDEEFFRYSYGDYYNALNIKITYNDGRPDDLVSFNEWQHYGYRITVWDSQYQKPWTKGATDNTIYVEYLGAKASFNVTIGDSPVESIEIIENEDATIYENSDGWDDITEDGDPFFYYDFHTSYYYLDKFSIKVNYNDTREPLIKNLWEALNEGVDGVNVIKTENQYQSPWVVGGQNNTITFEYMGVTTTYNAKIISNPVESVEIIDNGFPNLIENMNGDWDQRYNEATGENEDFFWYDYFSYLDKISLKITYNDGRDPVVHAVNGGELDGYFITHSDNQYSSPWVKGGDNTITFNYLGAEVTYNVNIIENPVESIEFVVEGNPTLIECADGYYNQVWNIQSQSYETYFYYELPSSFTDKLQIKINYKGEDTPKLVPFEKVRYGETVDGYYMDVSSYQPLESPWTVGGENNLITVEYLGSECTYNVEITESPVASIEIIDTNVTPLEENSNGWMSNEWVGDEFKEYFCYNVDYSQFGLKVNYKDENKAPTIVTDITKQKIDGYWVNTSDKQNYNNQWTVDGENNTIIFMFMGATATYNMPIISNPVESIEITSAPTKQYIYGDISNGHLDEDGSYNLYLGDFTGLAFTVHFKDNTTKNYTYNDIKVERGDYLVDGFFFNFGFTEEGGVSVGNNEVMINYRGVSDTYNVNVTESPVQSIEILEAPTKTEYTKGNFTEYYQGMKIKITYSDIGEKVITLSDENILYFAPDLYDTGCIYFIDNGYYYEIYTYIDATDPENHITKTLVKGMGMVEVGEELIIKGENYIRDYTVNSYDLNGNVNITITYEDSSTETFDLTPIAYKDWEGADDYYDRYFIAKTPHGTVCYNIYQGEVGGSYAFYAFYNGADLPDPEYTPGDIDDSGEVTLDDVVALAQVVAGWQNVSHNPSALDANGDGNTTLDDVVLLAQFVAGWGVQIS